jgi:hypothetical protein
MYAPLGDVVVAGWAPPTFATPMVSVADADGTAAPIALERVWTNEAFRTRGHLVAYWQPVPPYGYTCVGTWAATSDPTSPEPPRASVLRCVHSAYVVRAAPDAAQLLAANSGPSPLENGRDVSLWGLGRSGTEENEDEDDDGGSADALASLAAARGRRVLAPNTFIARRDAAGPGYNKYYAVEAIVQPSPPACTASH